MIKTFFSFLLAHKLISILISVIMAILITNLVTDADFIIQCVDKIGYIIESKAPIIVEWIVDYIKKIKGVFNG